MQGHGVGREGDVRGSGGLGGHGENQAGAGGDRRSLGVARDHVGAQERGRPLAAGRGGHLGQRAPADHCAVVEHHQLAGQRGHVDRIVGDQQGVAGRRLAEQGAQPAPSRGVHRGQRLVDDQDFGFGGQGPGDGHSLALAARQRGRALGPDPGVHADTFQQLAGLLPGRGPVGARPAQAEGHVVEHSEVAEQPQVLEHHARAALVGRHEDAGRRVVDDGAGDDQAAAGQAVEPGHGPPQRRLAGAVSADHRGDALADLQAVDPQHPARPGHPSVERDRHRGIHRSRRVTSTARATAISTRLMATADSGLRSRAR